MVDVLKKNIQSLQPLLDTRFNVLPFGTGNNTRDQIKWKNLFNALSIIINSKRDTLTHE